MKSACARRICAALFSYKHCQIEALQRNGLLAQRLLAFWAVSKTFIRWKNSYRCRPTAAGCHIQVAHWLTARFCVAADRERQSQDGRLIAWRNAAQSKSHAEKIARQ
jgi:hypothetical protein